MIRLLAPADAEAYAALRRAMLLGEPLAFASSPEDDVAGTAAAAREVLSGAPERVVLGAFRSELVGAVGLYRQRHGKAAHRAHVWGMYVLPEHRGSGLGSELLRAAVRHARSLAGVETVHLGVTSAAVEARRLYERHGFREWGVEPDALRHAGGAVAEHHLTLDLRGPAR